MSVPNDHGPDPHADPLIAAVLRAAPDEALASCPDAEVLALYAERELPGEERGAVEAHVVACARCQATVAAFVRGAPDQGATVAVGGTSAVPWWAGWRWLVPLASAAAVVAVAVWIGRGPASPVVEQARAVDARPAGGAGPMQSPAPAAEAADAASPRPAPAAVARAIEPRQEARAKSLAVPVTEAVPQSPAPAAAPQVADAAVKAVPPAPAAIAEAAGAGAAPARGDAASRERAGAEPGAPTAAGRALSARSGNAVGAAVAMAADVTTLTGMVTYRARIALPAGAVVDVRLLDVSRADAPATTLARAEIVTRGEQVPVPFTLRFGAGEVQPGRRYIVQATIAVDGHITWRTTTPHAVFAGGTAATTPITVVVDAVR